MTTTFDDALKNTLRHEKGYVDDPSDPGGETYDGISRRYHPHWLGWRKIDSLRESGTPFALSLPLSSMVRDFYRKEFWVKVHGDDVATISTAVSRELFDTAVNLGCWKATLFMQEALNLLNCNQKLYNDILEDGLFGEKTKTALQHCCGFSAPSQDEERLLKIMNALQAGHYISQMRKYPTKEKYRGWFART